MLKLQTEIVYSYSHLKNLFENLTEKYFRHPLTKSITTLFFFYQNHNIILIIWNTKRILPKVLRFILLILPKFDFNMT